MRISDWSSDVCSSDLHDGFSRLEHLEYFTGAAVAGDHLRAEAAALFARDRIGGFVRHGCIDRGDRMQYGVIHASGLYRGKVKAQEDGGLFVTVAQFDGAVQLDRSEEHTSELQS